MSEVGEVVSVNTSPRKSVRKTPVVRGRVIADRGLEGDAHAGDWHRQVSLLAIESIEKMRAKGLDIGCGDFAENITTSGVDLVGLPVGSLLDVGAQVRLQITQIGKVCHTRCAIYHQAGDCVMPKEGVFARVVRGGDIAAGDEVRVIDGQYRAAGGPAA